MILKSLLLDFSESLWSLYLSASPYLVPKYPVMICLFSSRSRSRVGFICQDTAPRGKLLTSKPALLPSDPWNPLRRIATWLCLELCLL